MTDETPVISVIIPVRNREAEIGWAIDSVLGQTFGALQLIVVDDGSDDETAAVIRSLADPRIEYVYQVASGVSAARNRGAEEASGRYLAFLDSDDEALPRWLEVLVSTLDQSGADVAGCGTLEVDPTRTVWKPLYPRPTGGAFGGMLDPLLPGNFAMKATAFRMVGGYDVGLRYSENTDLALRSARYVETGEWSVTASDECLSVRYERPRRDYGSSRADAACHILAVHHQRLCQDRRVLALYRGIAGVGAAVEGRKLAAVQHLAHAVVADPRRLAHIRRLAQVLVGLPVGRYGSDAVTDLPLERRLRPRGEVHGLLVTYQRPAQLADSLAALCDPRHQLASLTVVDNDAACSGRALVEAMEPTFPIRYVAAGENLGPAGGIALGMAVIEEEVAGCDWVAVIDDDDPPPAEFSFAHLHDFACWLVDRGVPLAVTGIVGGRLNRRLGRFERVPQRELVGPVPVDYVGGGQFPLIATSAISKCGGFDGRLFFGFDDLEFGLRVKRAGLAVIVDGAQWEAARARLGRTGDVVAPPERAESLWRRYYSIRNLIVIERAAAGVGVAARVTVDNVLGRLVVDIARRRPQVLRRFAVALRAACDAWSGRVGRTIEPTSEGHH